jgi:osmotically-inducible protein OsmY
MQRARRRRTLRAAISHAVRGARRLARSVGANVAAARREARGAAHRALADRDVAEAAVWEVRGVGAVRNMLRIRR